MAKEENKIIEKTSEIKATVNKVWDVLTNAKFAKILGNEFDKNAYLESEWKLGSLVHFKYYPDKIVATGKITEYKLHSHINVDYNEIGYSDNYSLFDKNGKCVLKIRTGPYAADYEAQLEVWDNWLLKVKKLSEGL